VDILQGIVATRIRCGGISKIITLLQIFREGVPVIERIFERRSISGYTVSQKNCQCYFLNNSVKHWPILKIFGMQHHDENYVNDCSFAHLTLILLLHYLMKSRSRSLAVYNNEFILSSACVGSENHCESTKSLKIVTCLTLIVSTLRSCC